MSQNVRCPKCLGTGKDATALELEKLGAVLPLNCAKCGGKGYLGKINARKERIKYLKNQIRYHKNQINIAKEEIQELEDE